MKNGSTGISRSTGHVRRSRSLAEAHLRPALPARLRSVRPPSRRRRASGTECQQPALMTQRQPSSLLALRRRAARLPSKELLLAPSRRRASLPANMRAEGQPRRRSVWCVRGSDNLSATIAPDYLNYPSMRAGPSLRATCGSSCRRRDKDRPLDQNKARPTSQGARVPPAATFGAGRVYRHAARLRK